MIDKELELAKLEHDRRCLELAIDLYNNEVERTKQSLLQLNRAIDRLTKRRSFWDWLFGG